MQFQIAVVPLQPIEWLEIDVTYQYLVLYTRFELLYVHCFDPFDPPDTTTTEFYCVGTLVLNDLLVLPLLLRLVQIYYKTFFTHESGVLFKCLQVTLVFKIGE